MIASSNDLLYFVELAQTLNFSRASERIGISQPSLTIAIKRLEHAIGTQLFIRSKNGAKLTHAGKRLLSHAKQLLQLWESVKSESLASHQQVQGSIVIGCHPSVALYTLNCLPALLSNYVKLEIQLKHDLSRKILEGVINLSIDIGIVVNPIKHPDLILHKLYDDQVTFWHIADAQNSNQNLYSEDAVLICDPDLLQTEYLLKQMQKHGLKYRRMVTTNNLELIANLTAIGAGIGILPTRVALSTHGNKLKPLTKFAAHPDEICLVYRHENRNIRAVQVILDAIKGQAKQSI